MKVKVALESALSCFQKVAGLVPRTTILPQPPTLNNTKTVSLPIIKLWRSSYSQSYLNNSRIIIGTEWISRGSWWKRVRYRIIATLLRIWTTLSMSAGSVVNSCRLLSRLTSKSWRNSIRRQSNNSIWTGKSVLEVTGTAREASTRADRSTQKNVKVSTRWPGMIPHRHPISYRHHREQNRTGEVTRIWTIIMHHLQWTLRTSQRSQTSFTMQSRMSARQNP